MINESVDGWGDSSARREFTVTYHAPGVGDEVLDSQGKLSRNEDDRTYALDDLHGSDSDKFSDKVANEGVIVSEKLTEYYRPEVGIDLPEIKRYAYEIVFKQKFH